MNTKDLIELKKQRIQEELQKLVPPGFRLYPYPKNRENYTDEIDAYYAQDKQLLLQVGYLNAENSDYDTAIQNLKFFGGTLANYKDYVNSGPFYSNKKLSNDFEKACDYQVRFYNLAKIIVKRVDDEIETELNLKHLNKNQQQKATKFVAGATNFRPGKVASIKSTKVSGIIPKTRAIPEGIVNKISNTTEETTEASVATPKRVISTLGRLTLDMVQISDNLDRVREVIVEDYKNTKELNKKEVDEYRKRLVNRGKKIGRKELGSDKTSLKDLVKKYVGGFFSGTGGAIRALALFNMLEAFANGNPLKAIGPLLGIGATYLPAIGQAVGGIIAAKVLGGIFKGGRGAAQGARAGAEVAGSGAKFLPKLGKVGLAGLGLGAGIFSAGRLLNSGDNPDAQQQRLEDLTQEQKGLTDSKNLTPIPEDDLQRFENLNKKFENSLDFLMGKQKDQGKGTPTGSGGGGGGGNPGPSPNGKLGVVSGEMLASNVEASYYDPSLGGINASGAKTAEGLPATSTGEGYKANVFSAAAFPSLLSKLSQSMTTANGSMPGGRTLASGQAFNLMVVDPKTGKQAIVRVNDVGSGVAGQSSNRMLDFSVAAKDYFGQNAKGLQIYLADKTSKPGALRTTGTVPPSPVLPQPTQTRRQYPNATLAPSSPSPVIVPFSAPQKQESSPMSMSDQGNNIINPVSTSYSDNFLTLYSRLIYQIV